MDRVDLMVANLFKHAKIESITVANDTVFITVKHHTWFCCGEQAILNHCSIGAIVEFANRLTTLFGVKRIVFRADGWAHPVDVTTDFERMNKDRCRYADSIPVELQFYGCQTAVIPGLIEIQKITIE